MVNLKNLAVKSLAIGIIRRVVSTLAILLLIISITSPFCSAGKWSIISSIGGLFWSYRSDFYHSSDGLNRVGHIQYWFSDYWFSLLNRYSPFYPKLIWMIMPIFVLQLLTLVFGIISVIFNRRILLLAPVCLSVAVLALVIYTTQTLFEISSFGDYQQGYYSSYYPVILFISAFALNKVTKNFPKYKTQIFPPEDAK